MIPQFKWNICVNCKHPLYFHCGNWLHSLPIIAQVNCFVKTCDCVGDGLIINRDGKICGLCGKGKICPCHNPQPTEPNGLEKIPEFVKTWPE